MALLETQTEIVAQCESSNNTIASDRLNLETPRSAKTLRSLGSSRSLRSIRSLRDIPLVNTSYDADIDSILGDRTHNAPVSYFLDGQNDSSGNTSNAFTSPIHPIAAAGTSSPRFGSGKASSWLSQPPVTRSRHRTSEMGVNLEELFITTKEDFASSKQAVEQSSELIDVTQTDSAKPTGNEPQIESNDHRSANDGQIANDRGSANDLQTASDRGTDNDRTGNDRQTAALELNTQVPSFIDESITNDNASVSRSSLTEKQSATLLGADQQSYMDEIGKCAGALASMKDYIETWAPTAHFVVTAAAALQRDSAAFAASLLSLLTDDRVPDPMSFANQFYQLREAYSSLLSLGDFSTVTYGQQGWTRASSSYIGHSSHNFQYNRASNASLEDNDTWDDRQLVDSLMTLLRTSPGFIASAIAQMSIAELQSFCGDLDDDSSPLNVMFYGVLGSAKSNRPRILAEIVKCLDHSLSRNMTTKEEKIRIFCNGVLQRLEGLAIGNITSKSHSKLDRFFRQCINLRDHALPEFFHLISSVVPDELVIFYQSVQLSGRLHIHDLFLEICTQRIQLLVRQLFTTPHMYGLIEDVFIGPPLHSYLEAIASRVMNNIPEYLNKIQQQSGRASFFTEYWQPDELIAVKGSDIVLMYNSLLPQRDEHSTRLNSVGSRSRPVSTASANSHSSQETDSSGSDDDEWCLDSIREDLVPVMQGLAHTTRTKVDGWQIFKIGDDGLVTDLGSDMGLNFADSKEFLTPQVQALCDAVAHYDGETVDERIKSARADALCRGDHLAVLDLQNVEQLLTGQHIHEMTETIDRAKGRCKILRQMLDQAAQDQRHERERLSNLLTTLDFARVHVWYETEVRNGQAFFRAREFLQVLYPKAQEEEEDRFGSNLRGSDSLKNSLGFSFGVGSTGYNGVNGNNTINSNNQGDSSGGTTAESVATQTMRSRRLSILSSHSTPESPFVSKPMLAPGKLNDKEVEAVNVFLRRNRCHNILPAEEKFTRALVEVANLARKLVDRDHLVSYVSFKRDRHYQTQYAQLQAQAQAGTHRLTSSGNGGNTTHKRNSHHHRRSSLGLFDFFDITNHQPSAPLTLHMTTSTQFLGLATSHDSLRNMTSVPNYHKGNLSQGTSGGKLRDEINLGPPRAPTIAQVQAIVLSDIGLGFMAQGTSTDMFMQQTGRMLLEGDSQALQPLIDEISISGSPQNKLHALEQLVEYVYTVRQRAQPTRVSRSDIIQELSKVIGREPGTIYRDLQVVSLLVNPAILNVNAAFEDCVEAARVVIDTVVVRSMDYAARILRYYMESTTTAAPQMALMGINDSVAIWAFCGRQGHREAQKKLAELYIEYPHLQLELRPLVKPSTVIDGVEGTALREAVALHWLTLASRI